MSDSDQSAEAAVRSEAPLVVVEAPAGCGKTFLAGQYARDAAQSAGHGRILVLAHTHAACDAFAERTRTRGNIDIRTIDSFIGQIAAAYHKVLGLPSDIGLWVRSTEDGYRRLEERVARLLCASQPVSRSLAIRYPIVICDEHQDASSAQHEVVMSLHREGALIRVFADPMQCIYGNSKDLEAARSRWRGLLASADEVRTLDVPHRWLGEAEELGHWLLAARETLQAGARLDLRKALPRGASVAFAESATGRAQGYLPDKAGGATLRALVKSKKTLLILASQNATVRSLRGVLYGSVPIWEGHVRDALAGLVDRTRDSAGTPVAVAEALVRFLYTVTKGFTASDFGRTLVAEVGKKCLPQRTGKPGLLQDLGRLLLENPDHRGVASTLRRLHEFIMTEEALGSIRIDYPSEYWDAVRLGQSDDPSEGMARIALLRSHARPSPPPKAISTVHKAKGLECDDVLVVPCDARHFRDTLPARCCLYVALTRARRSLTLVVSRTEPSPLVDV